MAEAPWDEPLETRYRIRVNQLPVGEHQYYFVLEDDLVRRYPDNPVLGAQVVVNLKLIKTGVGYDLRIGFWGSITCSCDRCLNRLQHPIESEHRILYSFDADLKELDDVDVKFVAAHETHLNLLDDLYELLTLEAPLSRQCEQVGQTCDPDMLRYLQQASVPEEAQPAQDIDPRWAALKKFMSAEPGEV